MAKRLRNPIVLPAGGASQANIDKSLEQQSDYLRNVVQKSVAGLDLESNHAVTLTANGTTVVNPAEGKDGMEKTTVTVAVPLEANKSVTIDVSAYTEPVEIEPTSGKDGMAKTTVTLTNIPSSDKALCCFVNETDSLTVYAFSAAPSVEDDVVTISNGAISVITEGITAVEDDTITVDSKVYTRNSDGDVNL